ncbi:MAG: hypothetical protein V2J65_21520, partial [Desulfobacteraceae bacterium]|nr:hypothetical protein [Desulfobacteraceae bacterium]
FTRAGAAGQKNGQSDQIRNFVILFQLYLDWWERFLTAIAHINRGWKPLPPIINYRLMDIELNEVSYKGDTIA